MTVQIFCSFQNTKYESHWCFKTQKANKMSKKERQKATKSPPSDTNEREERRTKVDMKQKILKKRTIENYTSNCQQ